MIHNVADLVGFRLKKCLRVMISYVDAVPFKEKQKLKINIFKVLIHPRSYKARLPL